MVVDKVAQAQQCIEFLRRNNVGRASFMVLEKLGKHVGDNTQTPEGVPRLFDLVKPKDPVYAPAFFKAIGNTLVANDLDQANRIAFAGKRWRVVTLDGALIETSGAMSGGGGQPSRGAMSSKLAAASVTPQVLQGYERDGEQAAQQLHKATNDLREAEQQLDTLKRRGPEIDLALQKIGMDIDNVKRRTTEAEKRVRDLRFVVMLLSVYILFTILLVLKTNPTQGTLPASQSLRKRSRPSRESFRSSRKNPDVLNRISKIWRRRFSTSVAQNCSLRNRRSMVYDCISSSQMMRLPKLK